MFFGNLSWVWRRHIIAIGTLVSVLVTMTWVSTPASAQQAQCLDIGTDTILVNLDTFTGSVRVEMRNGVVYANDVECGAAQGTLVLNGRTVTKSYRVVVDASTPFRTASGPIRVSLQLVPATQMDSVLTVLGSNGADKAVIDSHLLTFERSANFPGTDDATTLQLFRPGTYPHLHLKVKLKKGADSFRMKRSALIGNFGFAKRVTVSGGSGDDVLRGGPRGQRLFGGPGNDRLFGRGGNDRLVGGSGHDVIRGGSGNDTIVSGKGADNVKGGKGTDTCKCGPSDTTSSVN